MTFEFVKKSKVGKQIAVFPLFLSLAIIMSWLLINGEMVIPARIYHQRWIETYLVFFAIMSIAFVMWVIVEKRWKVIKKLFSFSAVWSIPAIVVGSAITGFLLYVIYGLIFGLRPKWGTPGELFGIIMYFGVIVAPIERLVFSYYLLKISNKYSASIWFAFFHLAISGFNWNFFFAMLFLNLLLCQIYQYREQGEYRYNIIGLPLLIAIHGTVDVMGYVYMGALG